MKKIYLLSLICLMVVLGGCSSDSNNDVTSANSENSQQVAVSSQEEHNDQTDDNLQSDQPAVQDETIVVIDPGHSAVVTGDMEPVGPGSSEMKLADTSGTSGVSTGIPEYELTLAVSEKLKTELESRGYTAILTRETNDVPLSCVERAAVATEYNADALVRIHANGSEEQSVQGAMTICITANNPYHPELYTQSYTLADSIITRLSQETNCENNGVWETDTMSGNNWSTVPATIVEMGYMTNPTEDEQMATEEYQKKIVDGIANGIDEYFATK